MVFELRVHTRENLREVMHFHAVPSLLQAWRLGHPLSWGISSFLGGMILKVLEKEEPLLPEMLFPSEPINGRSILLADQRWSWHIKPSVRKNPTLPVYATGLRSFSSQRLGRRRGQCRLCRWRISKSSFWRSCSLFFTVSSNQVCTLGAHSLLWKKQRAKLCSSLVLLPGIPLSTESSLQLTQRVYLDYISQLTRPSKPLTLTWEWFRPLLPGAVWQRPGVIFACCNSGSATGS